MKILVEFLKLTVKNIVEEIRNINFTMNENQMQEYEKNYYYSQEFKIKFSLWLN